MKAEYPFTIIGWKKKKTSTGLYVPANFLFQIYIGAYNLRITFLIFQFILSESKTGKNAGH